MRAACEHTCSCLWAGRPGLELLGCMVSVCLIFGETVKQFSKDDVVFVKVNNKKYYVHPYTLRCLLNNNTIACSSSKKELDAEYFSYVCSDSYSFSEWLIRYLRNNVSYPLDQLYLATLHEPTKTRLLAYDKYKEFADSFLETKNRVILDNAFKAFVESKMSE